MKAIIDTCVIIDALQKREPFWQSAATIFQMAATEQCMCYITAKSVADIYYLMQRATHNDADTRLAINKLTMLFKIADTTAIDTQNALFSDIADFEDAMMHETAIRIKANCIVTRNLKDYKLSKIPVFSPDDFITYINDNTK